MREEKKIKEAPMFNGRWLNIIRSCFFAIILLVGSGYCTQVGTWSSTKDTLDTVGNNIVKFGLSNGTVRITICAANIVRVDFDTRSTAQFTSTADVLSAPDIVEKKWGNIDHTVSDTGTAIDIKMAKLRVHVQKSPFRLSYYDASDKLITGEASARGMAVGEGSHSPWIQLTQNTDEHYFGWGITYGWYRDWQNIDNKGLSFSIKQSEANYMYSTAGYGIFPLFCVSVPHESSYGAIGNGYDASGFSCQGNFVKYWPSSGEGLSLMEYLSYFFIAGNWAEAIDGYTQISGRPALIGKRWYGVQRDIYKITTTSTEVKSWCDSIRINNFPMDIIRMDDFWDWGNFGYLPSVPNTNAWVSDAPDVVTYWKDNNFLFGGMCYGVGLHGCCNDQSTQPVAKCDDSAHAAVAVDHGFDFAWYDAMNFQARYEAKQTFEAWTKGHKGHTNVPGSTDYNMPPESQTWVAKGWMSLSSQSWPASHTGDDLQNPYLYAVFPATLMHHLVGYSVNATDLGDGSEWNYIGGAMRPIIQYHGAGCAGAPLDNIQTNTLNIFHYADDLKDCMRKWHGLHYRFIPYFFTYGIVAHQTGMPIWRGMMCQDGGEKDSKTYGLYMQCYVGDNIIISPYYEDMPTDKGTNIRHNIYLPKSTWYDYFKGTKYTPDTVIAEYPVTGFNGASGLYGYTLPMFVRAGAIIPLMPDSIQYIGAKADTQITVQVWPVGSDNTLNSFTLYEDEGSADADGNIATQPRSTSIYMRHEDGKSSYVTLGAFSGSRYCSNAADRKWSVEFHCVPQPQKVFVAGADIGAANLTATTYKSGQKGWYYDAAAGGVVYVNTSGLTGADAATGFYVAASYDGSAGIKVSPFVSAIKKIGIVKHGSSISVTIPFSGSHTIEIMDMQGKKIAGYMGSNATTRILSMAGRAKSVYLIRVNAGGQNVVKKMIY